VDRIFLSNFQSISKRRKKIILSILGNRKKKGNLNSNVGQPVNRFYLEHEEQEVKPTQLVQRRKKRVHPKELKKLKGRGHRLFSSKVVKRGRFLEIK